MYNRNPPIWATERKIDWKKEEGGGGGGEKKGAWGTYGTITKDLTFWSSRIFFPSGVPEGEGKESEAENIFKEITAEKFPSLAKKHKIQEAEWILTRINSKKSTPRHIKIKFLKTNNKKSQKQWQKNDTSLIRENNLNDSRFLITNYWGQKAVARHFSSAKIKGLSS